MAASELPGGAAAVTVHRGSYDGLKGVYDALDWIQAQGRERGRRRGSPASMTVRGR